MVAELREVERRQEAQGAEIAASEMPEPVPVLHPNLPALYRRRVEALEEALKDPATMAAATEPLRTLLHAVLVHPGERRGEVPVSLRGNLAAFLHAAETEQALDGGTAALRVENGRSGVVEKYRDRWMRGRASAYAEQFWGSEAPRVDFDQPGSASPRSQSRKARSTG